MLLAAARTARGAEAARLYVEAAWRFQLDGRMAEARGALERVDLRTLAPGDRFRQQVLRAADALDTGDTGRAAALLAQAPDARFTGSDDPDWLTFETRLRARTAALNGDLTGALRQRLFLDGLLPDPERPSNARETWMLITRMDDGELQQLTARATDPILRGWVELALVQRGMYPTVDAQQQAVDLWRRRWPEHPATDALPASLGDLPRLIAERPRHVALILPLSGPLASAGRALRDGFVAAQFEARASGAPVPRLSLYDTHALGAVAAYASAVDYGADIVIGPLDRSAVRELAALSPREVPLLALNVVGEPVPDAPVQFGLIPEDEGRQIAERASEDGLRRALVLTADTAWAERLARAFGERFEALGGEIVAQRSIGGMGEVGDLVGSALLIGESEARAAALERLLGQAPEFEPRRRADLDMVFTAADPLLARTLKPTLAYYFASDLPMYASSHVFNGTVDAQVNEELDGIRFCDMPWRLQPIGIRRAVEAAFDDAAGSSATFYAMGVDAWRLHQRLDGLQRHGAPFSGVTGELVLTPEGRLERRLSWAVIRSGRALPLPRVVSRSGP